MHSGVFSSQFYKESLHNQTQVVWSKGGEGVRNPLLMLFNIELLRKTNIFRRGGG